MDEKTPLSALSDSGFIALLKERQNDANWTMGQLVEYERRGSDFLANEEGLRGNIDTTLKDHYAKMRSIFEPSQKFWNAEARLILEPFQKWRDAQRSNLERLQESVKADRLTLDRLRKYLEADRSNLERFQNSPVARSNLERFQKSQDIVNASLHNISSEINKTLPPIQDLLIAPPSSTELIKNYPLLADEVFESISVEKATQSQMDEYGKLSLDFLKNIANSTEKIENHTKFDWRQLITFVGIIAGVFIGFATFIVSLMTLLR